jgi:hypothetical protein
VLIDGTKISSRIGEWPDVLQRRCVVAALGCINASLDALRSDGLRHRKREDQHGYGGQVSHGVIIGDGSACRNV